MTGRTATKTSGEESDTRERILAAAAPLFAEKGFESTGVRAIAAAAAVNIAAVNYHFGSKDALIDAVSDRHVNTVNACRHAALDAVLGAAAAAGSPPALEAVVEAFVGPSVRFVSGGSPTNIIIMRLTINRAKMDPENTGRRLAQIMLPTLRRFVDALALALPGSERAQLEEGLHFVTGTLLHEVSFRETMNRMCPHSPHDPESVIARLVAFGVGGIRALAAMPAPAAPSALDEMEDFGAPPRPGSHPRRTLS